MSALGENALTTVADRGNSRALQEDLLCPRRVSGLEAPRRRIRDVRKWGSRAQEEARTERAPSARARTLEGSNVVARLNCPSCKGYMNRAARASGAEIYYTWGDEVWVALP